MRQRITGKNTAGSSLALRRRTRGRHGNDEAGIAVLRARLARLQRQVKAETTAIERLAPAPQLATGPAAHRHAAALPPTQVKSSGRPSRWPALAALVVIVAGAGGGIWLAGPQPTPALPGWVSELLKPAADKSEAAAPTGAPPSVTAAAETDTTAPALPVDPTPAPATPAATDVATLTPPPPAEPAQPAPSPAAAPVSAETPDRDPPRPVVNDTPPAPVASPAVQPAVPTPAAEAVASTEPADPLAALRKAAEGGDGDAMHDLAVVYASGQGAPQDLVQAASWFGRAAEAGSVNAQYNYAVMLQRGIGTAASPQQAVEWYRKAAEAGHPQARFNLALAYLEGNGTPRDSGQAEHWLEAAFEAGVPQAAAALGDLYANGSLGRADTQRAMSWYRRASDLGDAQASLALAALERAAAQPAPATEPVVETASAQQAAETVPPAPQPAPERVDEARKDDTKAETARPVQTAAARQNRPVAAINPHDPRLTEPPTGDFAPALRSEIAEIQKLLNELDFDAGQADGIAGERTVQAIRDFQNAAGLDADGRPTRALLEELRQLKPISIAG
ncbi:peptidoglycan-binding protein [Radicibacter daui]|uniref:peptidoglycan-binding protein n=1 Tax=Radicibacter daui TaxID=3064829 RepID=UPI0040468ED9